MKKCNRSSSSNTLKLLPAQKDSTGNMRIYRDLKDSSRDILYYEDSKKDLLIREILDQDIDLIKSFQDKQVQVISRKYGSFQKRIQSKSPDSSDKSNANTDVDSYEISLFIFKKSSNDLLALVDVKCTDYENQGTIKFLFNPSVRSKYRLFLKDYFSKFLSQYNILKNSLEIPNMLDEYGINI